MAINSPDLCLGSSRFDSEANSPSGGFSDALPAWRRALAAQGPKEAAAQAKGDFAIGLRDADGRAFLAVDRFAMQTLCYRVTDGALSFAERVDALADENADIDPQAIFDYLYFHVIPSPRTIFAGVHRLPPGYCATFDNGRLCVEPYWIPAFAETPRPEFNALKQEFLHLLRAAVRRQIDGSKAACFLSGGTDSSTVAGLIREVTGQPPASYSIGFDAAGYDEMHYARIAARRFGTEHHEYYVTPDDLVRHLSRVAASYDQPFGNSSALPAYCCALQAKEDGVTRLLAGDGGDELFGGNARYAMQRVFGWYGRLPAALRGGMMEPFFGLPAVSRTPLLRKGAGYIRQARIAMPDRLQQYNLLRRLGAPEVLTPAFLAQVDADAVLQQQRDVWDLAVAVSEIDRTLAFDWRYTLAESDLPKVRGTTQLAGIDVAFPLLDDDLVDFSMRLPANYKLRGLTLRWFFKEALRGFLPDEIIRKKKHGFGLPFGQWTLQHEPLRKLATEALGSLAGRGIVRPEFIKALLQMHLPAHPGYYGEMVWILTVLESWLQHHRPGYRVD